MPEGRGFDSRLLLEFFRDLNIFSRTKSLSSTECQEYLLGLKAAGA